MSDGSNKQVFIHGGFADVSPSGLTLLAEEATMLEDFNMDELDQHIQDAREDVADSEGEKKVKAEAVLAHLEESKNAVSMAKSS